jgi:asparagine synthase (glutamine-hydrolysing)
MCGIVGAVWDNGAPPLEERTLMAMREAIVHRGPDDAGHHMGQGVALGSRRLSILDLSPRGRMPMCTRDGRYWIAYNGEVYNYRELRAELQGRGATFRSDTDTEVVLALYAEAGPSMLDRLNGMFAIAIWDAKDRTLFLARDRLGIKPLYYTQHDERLLFASEEKALFVGGVPLAFNPAVWEELLRFNYVAGDRTPFVGVSRLLPGHYLYWKDGRISIRRWWSLGEAIKERQAEPPEMHLAEWFRATFDDAVALRRISDVPVGVLLSGGVDSSSIASSLAVQAGEGVESFTVRFADDPHYDEGPLARKVAAKWHLRHHELAVPSGDALTRLRRASWYNDQPFAHYSDIYIGAISEYAKQRVTVLLSGEGSDEVLGGYVRYWPLRHPRLLSVGRVAVPGLAGLTGLRRLRKLQRMLALGAVDQLVLFNASNVFPDDLGSLGVSGGGDFEYRRQMVEEAQAVYPGEPARQAMYSDAHTFLCSVLDRNDRMTMGASIECRVPFLDKRLVEGLCTVPSSALLRGRKGKRVLIDAVGDRLPPEIRTARKWGFSVPWARYVRDDPDMRAIAEDLPHDDLLSSGPFERPRLRQAVDEFMAGAQMREPLIVALFMVSVWHKAYKEQMNDVRSAGLPPQRTHEATGLGTLHGSG